MKRSVMNLTKIKLIYFSPTRSTKNILEHIAKGTQIETVEHIDLTHPEAKIQEFKALNDELAILGVPVYGGRVPIDAIHRIQRLKANKTPAVIVVVYGNRAYEGALLELKDLVVEAGFIPIAGAAFIGEHTYSNENTPIAAGRPDENDIRKAYDFGAKIMKQVGSLTSYNTIFQLQANAVYSAIERNKRLKIPPSTKESLCKLCRICLTVCPTAAITMNNHVMTEQNLCISCCACVKFCPHQARIMQDPRIKQIAERLSTNFKERKEPEIFV